MAMNKDNKNPLKLPGRGIARVMFKDMCYMAEARGKLRSQCSQPLLEIVLWAWDGARAFRTENSGQALTRSKAGYDRGTETEEENGTLGLGQDDCGSDSDIDKNKQEKNTVLGRKHAFITGFGGWNTYLSMVYVCKDGWVEEERKKKKGVADHKACPAIRANHFDN